MDREQAIRLMQDLLRRMVDRKGSDLFITAGFPPAIKIDGEVRPQTEQGRSSPEQSAVLVRSIMNDRQTREFDAHQGGEFRDRPARHRPLPRQRLRAAGPHRLRDPPDQLQDPDDRGTRAAGDPEGHRDVQARPRDRGRRDRLGQVHDARLDGRLPQREDPRPHRHDRGPGRVRASRTAAASSRTARSASTPRAGTRR